mmetsp:Transcript_17244/g.39990  ORF Transcript_17244/g.39990 Transcript_17244/m.39990 type:complete len:110 (-) Transcript_17244:519-848(-)
MLLSTTARSMLRSAAAAGRSTAVKALVATASSSSASFSFQPYHSATTKTTTSTSQVRSNAPFRRPIFALLCWNLKMLHSLPSPLTFLTDHDGAMTTQCHPITTTDAWIS